MSLISVELGTDGGVARDCHNASRSGSIFSRDYSFESRLIQRHFASSDPLVCHGCYNERLESSRICVEFMSPYPKYFRANTLSKFGLG
jgi:hypothetical protein